MVRKPVDRLVLQAIVDRVAPTLDELADDIAGAYQTEIDDYARVGADLRGELVASALANLRSLVGGLASDDDGFDGREFERFGASRMRMGISIGALMRAFNVWGQRTWAAFQSSVDAEDTAELHASLFIGERIFKHVERASASTAAGFMRTAMSTWSDREITRGAMLEALLTGRIDADEISELHKGPEALAKTYVAVVGIRRSLDDATRIGSNVRRVIETVGRYARDKRPLVGIRHSALYMLWPVDALTQTGRLPEALSRLATEFPELAIGVGRQHDDLAGVRASFDEAQEAGQIARALGAANPIRYEAVLLERTVAASVGVRQLAKESLGPLLAYDAKKDAQLIPTLSAYIECNGSVTEAAKELHIHPNTVVYRLRRIGEIAHQDPHTPRGRLTLSLSLLARRLHDVGDPSAPAAVVG